jgi:hypothetical protein
MTLLIACVGMMFKDILGTGLMLAESRVRIWLAAAFDAGSDWANFVVTAYAATPLYVHGWTVHTVGVLVAVSGTSFFGTALWTYAGDRLIPKGNQSKRRQRLHPWLHRRVWHPHLGRWGHPSLAHHTK